MITSVSLAAPSITLNSCSHEVMQSKCRNMSDAMPCMANQRYRLDLQGMLQNTTHSVLES